MRVQLDHDVWEMEDTARLEEVLADLSDRAQAKGCLVTKLTVANRIMTDRELVPLTLSQPARLFDPIQALSERMDTLMQQSEDTAKKFVRQINEEAQEIVEGFRMGRPSIPSLDRWFGQMADYLEWGHIHASLGMSGGYASSLNGWVEELMNARKIQDPVRVADILEYEIIPLLTQAEVLDSHS
ncbi:MAG: hypothetical protein AB7P17_07925 [Nitrospirales bacterium]|nr:hypothetical protein [Nitrospirales bacterium]